MTNMDRINYNTAQADADVIVLLKHIIAIQKRLQRIESKLDMTKEDKEDILDVIKDIR